MNEFYTPNKIDAYIVSMITSVVTNILHSSFHIFWYIIVQLDEFTEDKLDLVKVQFEYTLEKMDSDLENYEAIYSESSDFLEE